MKAYEEQRSEENSRLAEEASEKARQEREALTKKTRIALAQTRLKKLEGYTYRPSNASELLDKAEQAVEACKSYAEYSSLHGDYIRDRKKLLALPSKETYDASAHEDAASGTNNDNVDTE